jgi:hypothetical protein
LPYCVAFCGRLRAGVRAGQGGNWPRAAGRQAQIPAETFESVAFFSEIWAFLQRPEAHWAAIPIFLPWVRWALNLAGKVVRVLLSWWRSCQLRQALRQHHAWHVRGTRAEPFLAPLPSAPSGGQMPGRRAWSRDPLEGACTRAGLATFRYALEGTSRWVIAPP